MFFLCRFFSAKKVFQEYNHQCHSLDSDRGGHFVGPDLGPNCLQRLTAEDKSYHKLGIR